MSDKPRTSKARGSWKMASNTVLLCCMVLPRGYMHTCVLRWRGNRQFGGSHGTASCALIWSAMAFCKSTDFPIQFKGKQQRCNLWPITNNYEYKYKKDFFFFFVRLCCKIKRRERSTHSASYYLQADLRPRHFLWGVSQPGTWAKTWSLVHCCREMSGSQSPPCSPGPIRDTRTNMIQRLLYSVPATMPFTDGLIYIMLLSCTLKIKLLLAMIMESLNDHFSF